MNQNSFLNDTICQNSHKKKETVHIKEIESMINNLPRQKAPGPDRFTREFYQTLQEKITPLPCHLFQKTEAEEILPKSLYEAIVTVIPTPGKDIIRKLQTNLSHKHKCKNPQKDTSPVDKKNYIP